MAAKKTMFSKISRRDLLKGFATTPVLALFTYDFWKQRAYNKIKDKAIRSELGLNNKAPAVMSKTSMNKSGEVIKIGLIGCGVRGVQLLKSAGFAEKSWYDNQVKGVNNNELASKNRLQTYFNQPDLNVVVTGICDVFDNHAERGIDIAKNGINPEGSAVGLGEVKRYKTYNELVNSKDVDAVVIATPDFHHAQMAIDAAKAGKHIYCEKAMTLTEDEMNEVVKAVKQSGVVFQLGNQNSKSAAANKAREIISKDILGKVTLIETTTNRNTKNGAWIRHLDGTGNPKPGSAKTIDWEQWLGNTERVPFSIERFYGWARWFAYDTGLAGQLFSHEIDAVNQVMGFGIPRSVVSSGGIYFHKEPRDMPDTFNSVLEFPDREFTMIYSASLANSKYRGRVFMGHDASMEEGGKVRIIPNGDSTRYADKIKNGLINPGETLFEYPNPNERVDGISSASEKYYADRGLIDTIFEGKNIDVTHLHFKDWIDVIRNGGETGCNIDKAYINTVAVHMVHRSYVEGRKVEWDPIKKK
ncbi:MAG: Gfo/Idh/MocA family oxidoreductase, partial [Melioribacteraceae bacterium]|nr:Gfo/Idh/MocA family oxidoreductase [Melioribacteraceae bacterium]